MFKFFKKLLGLDETKTVEPTVVESEKKTDKVKCEHCKRTVTQKTYKKSHGSKCKSR